MCDENTDPQMNSSANKRPNNAGLQPDSTTKRVKTEPNEFQPNDADTMANDTALVSGAAGGIATNNQLPSTSNTSTGDDSAENQNGLCPLNGRIKAEPIDLDENEAQPMQNADEVAIKTEPGCGCSDCPGVVPIKCEIKTEDTGCPQHSDGGGTATSSNELAASSSDQATATNNNQTVPPPNNNQTADQQAEQPPQRDNRRECCRHGIRCYR